MFGVDIFFSDLSEEKQAELLEEFRIRDPKELKWDLFPLVMLYPDPVSEDPKGGQK